MLTTTFQYGERSIRSLSAARPAPDTGRRSVYDCRHNRTLTNAALIRTEDGRAATDATVNRAFDGLGATRDFYKKVFNRNSIDNKGMRLNGYVHFSTSYQNAFWDGQEMVFGDGDGEIFDDFTKSLDVIGHELTHGVTQFTANLEYSGQSGALNESMSDVFGSLVKQWKRGQRADQADWLIGAEVLTPKIRADALRSMKAPGTAYDNDLLGKDPQPDHMSNYQDLPDTEEGDFGGVHINSGIPNKAFYLTAVGIGGHAWDAPGHIWYESLKASTATTNFQEFADTTHSKAVQLYGANSSQQKAVINAWSEVGIRISGPSLSSGQPLTDSRVDTLAELTGRIQSLAEQLAAVADDVKALKPQGV